MNTQHELLPPEAGEYPEWVAEVFPDWTTLRMLESGTAFAFKRSNGQIYKLPHPDCPFILVGERGEHIQKRP